MNSDGSGQTNLTNDPADDDYFPDWSPNGAKIAFARYPFFAGLAGGDAEIYSMSADGSGQTNRTNTPADDLVPSWSPSGASIAFTRYDLDQVDIRVVRQVRLPAPVGAHRVDL